MDEGWNWISINRPVVEIASVLGDYPAQHGDVIRGLVDESRYDTTHGWKGSLTELKPGDFYRMHVQRSGFLRMTGDPVDPSTPLTLRPGWNWVGYLPARRMPVGDALKSLEGRLVDGDAVVGQREFAQYVAGVGWVGTLTDMEPGKGYALYLTGKGSLVYPEPPEKVVARPPTIRETTANGPDWDMPALDHEASMLMIAEVRLNDTPLQQTTTKVAVMNGEEVRGLGEVHFVEELEQYIAFVMIYGALDTEEDLRVHVYDGERDALYEDVATVKYAAQSILGQASSPVFLELSNAGLAPELLDLPEEFALYPNYPNPFNPFTIIGYDLPEAARVTLTVYDVIGRRVVQLVNQEQPAGRHRAVFDAESYASGLYLYRLKAGDFTDVGKMILVK
jgi:hypothetical protein